MCEKVSGKAHNVYFTFFTTSIKKPMAPRIQFHHEAIKLVCFTNWHFTYII